jgi:hypothetical protein
MLIMVYFQVNALRKKIIWRYVHCGVRKIITVNNNGETPTRKVLDVTNRGHRSSPKLGNSVQKPDASPVFLIRINARVRKRDALSYLGQEAFQVRDLGLRVTRECLRVQNLHARVEKCGLRK